jgi:hypothetical protein
LFGGGLIVRSHEQPSRPRVATYFLTPYHYEIHRLRPVFAGPRYAGALIHTAGGWDTTMPAASDRHLPRGQDGFGGDEAAHAVRREGPPAGALSTQRLAGNRVSGLG